MALSLITNIVLITVLISLIVAFAYPVILNVRRKTYGKDFWTGFILLIVLSIFSLALYFILYVKY
jgi:hypothetical protein